MPISTFPRHYYYEDEYILKTAGLRDTHSEGKVKPSVSVVRSSVSYQPHRIAPLQAIIAIAKSLPFCAGMGPW